MIGGFDSLYLLQEGTLFEGPFFVPPGNPPAEKEAAPHDRAGLPGPAERRQVGGLGMRMVKKFLDQVTYACEDGQNVLTLYKNLTGKKRRGPGETGEPRSFPAFVTGKTVAPAGGLC